MSTSSPQFCKPCRTAITREWAQAHPTEWERHKRKSYLKRKYGLTIEDADALIHKHEGKCAICGKSGGDSRGFRMHVDHKPGTRTVRGILCTLCNNGLGVFRDQPELLVRAAAYLVCTELNGPGPWRLEPEFVAAALQEIQSAAR